jgi:hypothetical protein
LPTTPRACSTASSIVSASSCSTCSNGRLVENRGYALPGINIISTCPPITHFTGCFCFHCCKRSSEAT